MAIHVSALPHEPYTARFYMHAANRADFPGPALGHRPDTVQDSPFCSSSLSLHYGELERLFGDLDTTNSSKSLLEVTIDGELTSGQGTNHEETSTNTSVRSLEAELLADLDEAGGGSLTGETLGLVDLGKHGVGGLRDNGGGETSDQTGTEVDEGLLAVGEGLLRELAESSLSNLLVDDELGHGVGDLLEEDGSETSVESTDTLRLEHLGETTDETVGVGGLRDETDTGSLKGAESDISEELGGGGRGEVDGSSVVGGILKTDLVDPLLLEELVSSKLQGTLEEVTSKGRAGSGEESTSTLLLDDLLEATEETSVVGGGVKLDSGLDDIDGGETTVGDGAADGTSQGESRVEAETRELLRLNDLGKVDLDSSSHCDGSSRSLTERN